MDLRTLEDLLALIDTRSLSDAAAVRHITQPAFSRRIIAIETELGLTVLDRSHRPAQVLQAVREKRAEIEQLAQSLRRLRSGLAAAAPLVDICAMHSLGLDLVPATLDRARQGGALERVQVHLRNRDDCYALLMTDQASIMLAYESDGAEIACDEATVEKVKIGEDMLSPFIGETAAATLLAGEGREQPIPFIDYPDDSFFGAVMRRRITPRLEARLSAVAVSSFVPTVVAMAGRGLGVAWVPARLVEAVTGLVDLRDRLGCCPLSLVALRKRRGGKDASDGIWKVLMQSRGSGR
ncbi:MAG: LysR family transcriptional regulator [Inquilinus sp.]|uniref:LysR family transcriptional regulator n=1 Tax=Inquilinus sp. TaxID=1932117 RepID=UPI003F3503BD